MKLPAYQQQRRIVTCVAMGFATAAVTVSLHGCGTGITTGGGGGGGSGSDFLSTGRTSSFFNAAQVDPRSEDSAGPQFVVAADLNDDGRPDLVSAWNQSQPVQIHLQRRDGNVVRFETVTLAGNIPSVAVAGLAVADFDGDGAPDIAVLIKESLVDGAACLDSEQTNGGLNGMIVVYRGPADPAQVNQSLAWDEVQIGSSFLQGAGELGPTPEESGFTSLVVGDMDNDDDPDIVVAWNSACDAEVHDAVIFINNGSGAVRDGNWSAIRVPDTFPKGTKIKDVTLADIDLDTDLDIVATFPDAPTMNVRWFRNPTVDIPDDYHFSDGTWQAGLIGHLATGADLARTADVDNDGLPDVVVRSAAGRIIQWFRNPEAGPTTAPLRSIPWQVYTLAAFSTRTPAAIALADLNDDGQLELVASADGGILWFDAESAATVYDQWPERLIVDDQVSGSGSMTEPDAPEAGTLINSVTVVDLDGDGSNDIVTSLDRSGLTSDALAWLRSTLSN